MTATATRATATRQDCADFLFREARLLDERRLEEWLRLFAQDGLYWIPIDESKPADVSIAHVRDDALRREERVYHLLHLPFPAQTPRSRTVHTISNIEVEPGDRSTVVRSNQVVYAFRWGDGRQIGLGQITTIVGHVEHVLRPENGELRIELKKILLIDREKPPNNLTFII